MLDESEGAMTELFLRVLQMSLMAAGSSPCPCGGCSGGSACPPWPASPVAGGGRPHAPPRGTGHRPFRAGLAHPGGTGADGGPGPDGGDCTPACGGSRRSPPSFAIPEAVPAPEEAPAAEGLSVLDVLAWLWLAGVLAVGVHGPRLAAAAAAAGHRRLAGLCADGLVVGERPHPHRLRVRVLPPCVRSAGGGETLRWVLLHERAHIKLGHHRYKAVYFLLAGLHWFNPMLWLSWVLLGRDLEVACDEKVLSSACGSPRSTPPPCWPWPRPTGALLPPALGRRGEGPHTEGPEEARRPWMAAVLFVLAVALGLLLLNDPPFPDHTVNGQYPTLRIQMEQDARRRR